MHNVDPDNMPLPHGSHKAHPSTWVPGVVMGGLGAILMIIGIVWIFSNVPTMIGALRDFSNVQANR